LIASGLDQNRLFLTQGGERAEKEKGARVYFSAGEAAASGPLQANSPTESVGTPGSQLQAEGYPFPDRG
jgi:hypothetical protein